MASWVCRLKLISSFVDPNPGLEMTHFISLIIQFQILKSRVLAYKRNSLNVEIIMFKHRSKLCTRDIFNVRLTWWHDMNTVITLILITLNRNIASMRPICFIPHKIHICQRWQCQKVNGIIFLSLCCRLTFSFTFSCFKVFLQAIEQFKHQSMFKNCLLKNFN